MRLLVGCHSSFEEHESMTTTRRMNGRKVWVLRHCWTQLWAAEPLNLQNSTHAASYRKSSRMLALESSLFHPPFSGSSCVFRGHNSKCPLRVREGELQQAAEHVSNLRVNSRNGAQCGHMFQFLKKSQISKFSCEMSPFLMFATNVHHAWGLDPASAP